MVWRDIDIELTKQHDGDITVDTELNAVINSITNIFKTIQGSRRMVPSFASPTHNLLFNQIDDITLSHLEGIILQAIETWEDRIYINYIHAVADADNNRIDIKIEFRLKNDVEDKVYNINETLILLG